MPATIDHKELAEWIAGWEATFQPASVHVCDGSAEEYEALCQLLVDAGTFTKLDEAKRPASYLALSDPSDVARVEDRTFIASVNPDDAGPTNNWRQPEELKAEMLDYYKGVMRGRCMSYRSPWAHSARRSLTSACSSPIRRM